MATNGWCGASITMDGTGDYVDCGTGAEIQPDFPFTYSGWMLVDSLSSESSLLGTSVDTTPNYSGGFTRIGTNGSIASHTGDGSGAGSTDRRSKLTSASLVSTSTWHHYAITNPSLANFTIYLDGVDVGGSTSGTAASMQVNANNFNIGRDSQRILTGDIAHVQIWDRTLTAGEVNDIRWNPGTILNGLVGYWGGFDNATQIDLTGTGNNGTLIGDAAESSDGPPIQIGLGGN